MQFIESAPSEYVDDRRKSISPRPQLSGHSRASLQETPYIPKLWKKFSALIRAGKSSDYALDLGADRRGIPKHLIEAFSGTVLRLTPLGFLAIRLGFAADRGKVNVVDLHQRLAYPCLSVLYNEQSEVQIENNIILIHVSLH